MEKRLMEGDGRSILTGAEPAMASLVEEDREEVFEVRFEPTLFLFLGTSPGQVGWRLKELLHRAYGEVPVLRFLWVDTDITIDPQAARRFSSRERSELVGFNGGEVVANLDAYPSIDFWPEESRLEPGFITRGANQIRLHGRLALFRMFNDRTDGLALIDRLRTATEALQQIENVDATEALSDERMRYIVERDSVRVVIVFSTCGGAGSAMAFDVAYLCRHLLRGSNPTVVGVALLPPVLDKAIKNETPSQREKIRANTYAWFKEDNYLLENPSWRRKYPEGASMAIHASPFDLRFVVDIANQAGDRLNSDDDVYAMVARSIFLDTGSSIGGVIRGFNANVNVLLEEFQGRRRAYSSLAAASLIYPEERILNYCTARLSRDMIHLGLLARPEADEVAEATSALLGRLGLRDAQVLETLLADRRVSNLNEPAIRKADSVEDIRGKLTTRERRNEQERQRQRKRIAADAESLLEKWKASLEDEITTLAIERGVPFARAVLDLLTDEVETGPIRDSTLSLPGFKARLDQQGISEEDRRQAEEEYRAARERLRALEGGFWNGLRKRVRPGAWRRDLDRGCNDCLQWMAKVNQRTLQLAAQRRAANDYDQLAERARGLRSVLARVAQTTERAADDLKQVAQRNLKPATAEEGVYKLVLEAVDADYIQAYHQKRAASVDPAAAYQALARELEVSDLEAWAEDRLVRTLYEHAADYFAEELEETSLLEALAEYHGEKAPEVIEAKFDRLVRYCHPFWQYNRDSGLRSHEGKSIIGVEDEYSELIPASYRDSSQYEIKSTGFKHRVDVVRIQHGLPAFLLRGMADYKAYYDAKREGLDPLHVLPEAVRAEEVIPEDDKVQEARQTFAVAVAFGYVVHIGTWYYFDPDKEHETADIHPDDEYRLAQGRKKAKDAFARRDEWVRLSAQLVEKDIRDMGNQAAVQFLDDRIAEHKESLSKMEPDDELWQQYRKEIQALEDKQRQLGRISPDLDMLV